MFDISTSSFFGQHKKVISAILWREQVTFWWNDDDFLFVLHQHAELELYGVSSLKQQSACRHVVPLGHNILFPGQHVFAIIPY